MIVRRAVFGVVFCVLPALALCAPSVKVTTATVKRQGMAQTITAFGQVQPNPRSATTRAATYAAFVQTLDVTLGQAVTQGEPIVTLRTAPSARANYRQAKANLHYARQAVTRQKKLLRQHLATHANVESARQKLATAKAAFATQKTLGTGEKIHVIKAPFAGIVSKLPIAPGGKLSVGATLFQLARRDQLQVSLGIEPAAIRRVEQGTPVRVQPLFATGSVIEGHVSQVDAVVDPNTHLISVVVPLQDGEAKPFLPGMRVRAVLTLAKHKSLVVPRGAVRRDKQGAYVFVITNAKARRVNVTTGVDRAGKIAVRGRLKVGQKVAVAGSYELSDGMAVRGGGR